jgi:2-polyprenyl-3-methyl-5-hydroxy-6-metoxy-1,4-benzoquinol methylase
MREEHYQEKSVGYGIGKTRLKKVLNLIGNPRELRILDIGCATGYLGSKLKEMGATYVAGIEISAPAAEKAKEVLNDVYTFDLEKAWPNLGEEKFDLAVLAEIVEHVFDPVEVLKKVSQYLKPEGEVIITTPNIISWTQRLNYLFGKWEYTDQGVLDFGHIRLFTYRYLKKVLEESGLVLVRENHIIFPGKLTKILKLWPSLFANQFVIKARKM